MEARSVSTLHALLSRYGCGLGDFHGQVLDAIKKAAPEPVYRTGLLQRGQQRPQRLVCCDDLFAGEVHPYAEMRAAAAECYMRVRVPGEIQPVRLGEDCCIVVGRDHPERDSLALANRLPADFGVLQAPARVVQDRRSPVQHLLGREGTRSLTRDEPPLLLRVSQQRLDGVGQQVTRGLVPAGEEQRDEVAHPPARRAARTRPW